MRGALVILLLLVAGCSGRGDAAAEPAAVAAGPETVTAGFDPGGLANVIVVRTTDRRPLRSATLVSPDGERVPAYSLDVHASPIELTPLQQLQLRSQGSARSVTRLDAMLSTALIRLPDPVRYAREWQSWHIEGVLGDPGAGRAAFTLPAPRSPPV